MTSATHAVLDHLQNLREAFRPVQRRRERREVGRVGGRGRHKPVPLSCFMVLFSETRSTPWLNPTMIGDNRWSQDMLRHARCRNMF